MREHIITFRVDGEELTELESAMDDAGYDTRAKYCRDAVLGRIQGEDVPSTPGEYAELRERVQSLEAAVFDASTDRIHTGPAVEDEPNEQMGIADRVTAAIEDGAE